MKRSFSRLAWLLAILSLSILLVACERMLQEEPATVESTSPGLSIPTLDSQATPLLPPAGETPAAGQEVQPTAPGTAETPAAMAPTEAAPPQDVIHTVVAGDTLGNIAQQYGVTAEQIAAANNLTLESTLDIGQQLLIPLSGEVQAAPTPEPAVAEPTAAPPVTEERVHIVQPGDNLYRIGLQYGFTIEQLATYNNLTNPDRLEVGQQIRIPPEGYTVP